MYRDGEQTPELECASVNRIPCDASRSMCGVGILPRSGIVALHIAIAEIVGEDHDDVGPGRRRPVRRIGTHRPRRQNTENTRDKTTRTLHGKPFRHGVPRSAEEGHSRSRMDRVQPVC